MKKHTAILSLATGLLTIWAGSAFSAYTNVVNGTTNILVGSFLVQDLGTMPYINPAETFRATNAVSWVGLKTRIDGTPGAQAQTKGAVEGSVSFLAGHTIGDATYEGIDINNFSGVTVWRDLVRYGGEDQGGLILWEFDLSAYLAGKTIGPIPGQSNFQIKMDYGNRRTTGLTLDVPFYLSYNDGAGLTLDTTVTTNLTPAPRLVNGILTNTAHFVRAGAVPAGPPAAGVVTFDITDHILASTDKVFRVAGFVTEFKGDIDILNDSGIIEVIVDPETAPPFLSDVSVLGTDLVVTFYSTTNRTYALESATDLVAANWTPIPGFTNFPGGQVTTSVTNPVGGAAEAIRVLGLPPKTLFPLEDFESGAANWVPDGGGVWQLGAPSFGATNAISGTQVYGTVLTGPYPENRTAGLRSPVIDLTTANKATLSYWQYRYIESFDWARIYVRDASGNALPSPLDLPIYEHDGDSAEYPWALNTVSLPAEALGQQITLEFQLDSDQFDAFAGWYIDDVLILEQ